MREIKGNTFNDAASQLSIFRDILWGISQRSADPYNFIVHINGEPVRVVITGVETEKN